MSYYQKHIFFCNNQKQGDKACCANHDALECRAYMKKRLKQLDLSGVGKHRANLAGCMGRCALGPVLVIYPEGVWYTYQNLQDIDEIIETHIIGGKLVPRLNLGVFSDSDVE